MQILNAIQLMLPGNALGESALHQIGRGWHEDIVVMVSDRLPKVLMVLFLLFLMQRMVQFFVKRLQRLATVKPIDPARAAKFRTVATILRATGYSILGFVAFLQILHLLNFDYRPLLASAGILGVGIGLGAQSLFKDIINGIFILVEDQYNVGETIKVAALTGTVEDLTLRSTRLRDADGTLYVIPNSQIATVANMSRDFAVAAVSISVDASAPTDQVLGLLREVAAMVYSDPAFKNDIMTEPGVSGVDSINGRALGYGVNARVRIAQKDNVLRALRTQIIETFKREQIPLGLDPANMLLLQQQRAVDPTATPAQQPLTSA